MNPDLEYDVKQFVDAQKRGLFDRAAYTVQNSSVHPNEQQIRFYLENATQSDEHKWLFAHLVLCDECNLIAMNMKPMPVSETLPVHDSPVEIAQTIAQFPATACNSPPRSPAEPMRETRIPPSRPSMAWTRAAQAFALAAVAMIAAGIAISFIKDPANANVAESHPSIDHSFGDGGHAIILSKTTAAVRMKNAAVGEPKTIRSGSPGQMASTPGRDAATNQTSSARVLPSSTKPKPQGPQWSCKKTPSDPRCFAVGGH